MFVEVDLTKKLPKFFAFKSEKGGDTTVEFVYPWLPPRCTDCSKWGHLNSDCVKGKVSVTVHPEIEVVQADEGITETPEDRSDGNMRQVLVTKETGLQASTKGMVKTTVGLNEEEVEEGELKWHTPTKVGRSPIQVKGLRYGEVSIMANTFSCLSDKGEQGESIVMVEEIAAGLGDTGIIQETKNAADESKSGGMNLDTEKNTQTNDMKGAVEIRQSLPRASKDSHKYLNSNMTQGSRIPNPNAAKQRKPKPNP